MEVFAKQGIKSVQTTAIITRADGTVEDLGVIAFKHTNPFVNLWWHIKRLIGR